MTASPRKVVLLLSGWSDGPLDALRHYDPAFADCRFVQVDIPTPPVGVRWCLNPWFLALLAVAALAVPAVLSSPRLEGVWWVGRTAALCAVVIVVRLLVARLVRRNVSDSIEAAKREIARLGGRVDAVVGFSWGGGALWRWLAEDGGPPATGCLLLAPTVGAIAAVAARPPPMTLEAAKVDADRVHVLVGTEDPFMGSVEHALAGATVHKVADDHLLCQRQSRALASRILQSFLTTQHRGT